MKRTEQAKINRVLRLLDNSYKIEINKIKVNSNSKHEKLKRKVAESLIKDGKQIITEAIFLPLNGRFGRCDILNLTDGEIIEIRSSETLERFESKKRYYPKLKIKYIRC